MATNYKEILVNTLGLEATADDAAIENAASTFQTELVAYKTETDGKIASAATELANSKAEVTKISTERDTIKNSKDAIAKEAAECTADKFADVVENRADIVAQLTSDREGTLKVLNSLRKKVDPKGAPLFNSRTAGQPAPVVENAEGSEETATAKKIANRARELQNSLKIPFNQAFTRARGEMANAKN